MKPELCACLEPRYSEHYCQCEMLQRGLKLNEEEREKEFYKAKSAWKEFLKHAQVLEWKR